MATFLIISILVFCYLYYKLEIVLLVAFIINLSSYSNEAIFCPETGDNLGFFDHNLAHKYWVFFITLLSKFIDIISKFKQILNSYLEIYIFKYCSFKNYLLYFENYLLNLFLSFYLDICFLYKITIHWFYRYIQSMTKLYVHLWILNILTHFFEYNTWPFICY